MIKQIKIFFIAILAITHLSAEEVNYRYENIAENLSHPWAIAVIDNNNILFTELSGSLRIIEEGVLNPQPIAGVPEVLFAGQGGLSGLILDPNFALIALFTYPFLHRIKARKQIL